MTLTTSTPSDDPSNNSSETTFEIVGDPTPTTTATPEPPATPVATPAKLPITGGEEPAGMLGWLTLAGALAIGLSLLARRFARR